MMRVGAITRRHRCAVSTRISERAGIRPNFTSPSRAPTKNSGPAAATPVQMLSQDWASIYTVPQTTQNQLAFLTTSATWKPSDTWTYQALAYFRNFRQSHVDGNGTDASNDPTVCPDPTLLCFPN